MVFELVTGDYLFKPKKAKSYTRDDDHLALIIELIGHAPKEVALSGKRAKDFFDLKGDMKRIRDFKFWPLKKVLMEKYRLHEGEADMLADFILLTVRWVPRERATAQQLLQHPWLDYKGTEEEDSESSDTEFVTESEESVDESEEKKGS